MSTAVEIAPRALETANVCRHTGKGHSGKGFFPVLPIFSSISAVLKSTVQRQKAAAAQLWWDPTEGQNPTCFRGVGCENLLGLQADALIFVHSNSIFLRFQPRFGSIEVLQGSSREGRDQKVWLKKMAWCAFIVLLGVCNKGCWFSCVPLPRGFTQRIFLDSVPKEGGKIVFPFKHCSLFPCLIAAAKEGWPQMCFFPAKDHRKIFPGNQTLLVGCCLWDTLV